MKEKINKNVLGGKVVKKMENKNIKETKSESKTENIPSDNISPDHFLTLNLNYQIFIPAEILAPGFKEKFYELIENYINKGYQCYYIKNIKNYKNIELPLLPLRSNICNLTLETEVIFYRIGEELEVYLNFNDDGELFGDSKYVTAKINSSPSQRFIYNKINNKESYSYVIYNGKEYKIDVDNRFIIKITKLCNSDNLDRILVEADLVL